MPLPLLKDIDCKTQHLKDKTIGIIGFGAQGKAQAQNLKDSGYQVKIGLKNNSDSISLAQSLGFETLTLLELTKACEFLVFLLPDEWHKEAFTLIAPELTREHTLCFAHGFSVHFGEIVAPDFLDVIMVAPKAAGHAIRSEYLSGRGVISLIAVHQNPSSKARDLALEYACGLGSGRTAIFESSFKDECECDLFSEQSVICGGVDALIQAGFETLTQAGYPEEIAYFECLHELKLVVDLIYAKGLSGMREHISNTAEYGILTAGDQVINTKSKEAMQGILKNIQKGDFAKAFLEEKRAGFPKLKAQRQILQDSQIENIGKIMRGRMPWLKL